MKIRFLYNFLFINSCKEILFPLGIRGLIELDDLVLVFIYGSTEEEMESLPTNNVYAFNAKAEQVWQIQEPFQPEGIIVSYADISLKKTGEIVAGTTQGTEYIVNSKNGSITLIKDQRPW